MNKINLSNNEESLVAETIVGHSVRIEGDLVSEGDIKVDGSVTGKVKTSQNLFIGPTAKIEADVEAGSATVAGTIIGNMKVKDLLVILQTGYLTGDVDCGKLAIEEGSYFNGKCVMTDASDAGAAEKPTRKEKESETLEKTEPAPSTEEILDKLPEKTAEAVPAGPTFELEE